MTKRIVRLNQSFPYSRYHFNLLFISFYSIALTNVQAYINIILRVIRNLRIVIVTLCKLKPLRIEFSGRLYIQFRKTRKNIRKQLFHNKITEYALSFWRKLFILIHILKAKTYNSSVCEGYFYRMRQGLLPYVSPNTYGYVG